MSEQQHEAAAADANGWEWAVVEIFGHRKHAGRIREEERFGAKMLRVDVPTVTGGGEPGAPPTVEAWATHWYGGASIFSLTLTDEASVMRANRPYAAPARISYREREAFDAGEGYDDRDREEEDDGI